MLIQQKHRQFSRLVTIGQSRSVRTSIKSRRGPGVLNKPFNRAQMSSNVPAELPPFDLSRRLQFTEPPHPSWTLGQKADATSDGEEWQKKGKEGWKTVETAKEDPV